MNIIDDSDENISIKQYVIDHTVPLQLNPQQKKIEIEKLLLGYYDDIDILYFKTSFILNFLNNPENTQSPSFKNLKPVVSFLKKIYVKDQLEYVNLQKSLISTIEHQNNTEYLIDSDNHLLIQKLQRYLIIYNNKITGKDNYLETQKLLWKIQTPFTNSEDGVQIKNFTDGFRSSIFSEYKNTNLYLQNKDNKRNLTEDYYNYETIRLIPQIIHNFPFSDKKISNKFNNNDIVHEICEDNTKYHNWSDIKEIYNGDRITDIIGYYNRVDNNIKKYEIFDFDKYFNQIYTLKINDNVWIYFNVLYFNDSQDIVKRLSGRVVKKKKNKICIEVPSINIQLTYNKKLYNNFFIYKKDFDGFQFYKPLLLSNNIAFKINITRNDRQYIEPQCIKEYLLLEYNNIKFYKTFFQVNTYLLKKYNVLVSNNDDIAHVNKLLNNKILISDNKQINNVVSSKQITLKSRQKEKDKGYYYILLDIEKEFHDKCSKNKSHIEDFSSSKKNILVKLAEIKRNEKNFEFFPECKQYNTIAKIYRNKRDLENDNYKNNIYFDTALYKNNDNSLKKKVSPGNYAILYDSENNNTLYIRKKVVNSDYWHKVTKLQSDITQYCSDKLLKYNELTEKNTCTLDTFDNICKKWKTIKNNNVFNHLNKQYSLIEKIIKQDHENLYFTNRLKNKINFYYTWNSTFNNNIYDIYIQNTDKLQDNYIGDPSLNYKSDNIEFKNKDTYVQVKIKQHDIIEINQKIKDFISPLLTKCKIDFNNESINIIYDFLNEKYQEECKEKQIETEKINEKIKKKNKKIGKSLDQEKVDQLLISRYKKLWTPLFKNIILDEISIIILTGLEKPIYMTSIKPFISKDIHSYFSEILDLFVLFYQTLPDIINLDYLFKNIEIDKDSIIKNINENTKLKLKYLNIIKSADSLLYKSYKKTYEILNLNFKPNFHLDKNKYDINNPIIKYITSLNESVYKKDRNKKISLINSCCLTNISDKINLHQSLIYPENIEYKIAFIKNQQPQITENLFINTSISFNHFHINKTDQSLPQNNFQSFIEIKDNFIFYKDPLLLDYNKNIDNIKLECKNEYNLIISNINPSKKNLSFIIDSLGVDQNIDIYNIRKHTIFHCIKIIIPRILSKIDNNKIDNFNKSFNKLVENCKNNNIKTLETISACYLNNIEQSFFSLNDKYGNNLIVLCYILIKIIKRILENNNNLYRDIVTYIIESINNVIENSEIDHNLMKMRNEEFREISKNKKLAIYDNIDIKDKPQIKQLKNIGLNVYDIKDNTIDNLQNDTNLNYTNILDPDDAKDPQKTFWEDSNWQSEVKNSEEDYDDS